MKELSLNILDIVENSIAAGARQVAISVIDQGEIRTLRVEDDGCGMSPDFVASVTDPFTTTRTTRPVGMGIPLLKLAAEQTGGTLTIVSRQSSDADPAHGTTITATFYYRHVDAPPLGDMASTMITLIQGNPELSFTLTLQADGQEIRLDTDEMREILGPDVPLNEPSVLVWIRDYLDESR